MHLLRPFHEGVDERHLLYTTLQSFQAHERVLFTHEAQIRNQGIFWLHVFTPVLCLASREIEPSFYLTPKTGIFQWTHERCKLSVMEKSPLFGTVLVNLKRCNEKDMTLLFLKRV